MTSLQPSRIPPRRAVRGSTVFILASLLMVVPLAAQDTYQTPAPELAALVDAPVTPGVSLSPDASLLLLMERPSLPSIAEVSAPELRLAGLRINPHTNGPSRARPFSGLALRTMEGEERPVVGLPPDARIRNVDWSPDGSQIAFTLDREDRIELWVANVATARARRLLDAAPAWTYQDLLANPFDEALFEHYAMAQLVRVDLDGVMLSLGEPMLVRGASPSPDGSYVLVQATHRPFSYQVPGSRFPNRIEVWDLDGNVVKEVADLPLAENVPTAFGSVPTGIRSISWRPDAASTLYWAEALDGGDAHAEADERDRVFMLEAPFAGEPVAIATLPLRYAGVSWSEDGFALVTERWWATRQGRVYVVDPDAPSELRVLFDLSYEDRYADPGRPLTRQTEWGTNVILTADGGNTLFLTGQGASPEGNRPFLRRLTLETGDIEELFRSEAPYYEIPIDLIDDEGTKLLTRRETNTDPPNFYVRDLESGKHQTVITPFSPEPNAHLHIRHAKSICLNFAERDAVPARGLRR